MTDTTLAHPLRAAWNGFRAIAIVCLIAAVALVALAFTDPDWNLFQFLFACGIFFTALCFARPLSRRVYVGEREAFLLAGLVIWVFLMISDALFSHDQTTASASKGNVSSGAFYQALSWIVSCMALFFVSCFRPNYLRRVFVGPLKWASIFAIVAVISCPLSPKPSYSAALAFKLCLIVLTLCAMGEAIEDEAGMFRLFVGLFVGSLIIVSKMLVVGLNLTEFLTNTTRFPNVGLSGAAGILLLLCALFFALEKNLLFLMFALYAVVVMMIAGNKGGMVASFVSFITFFLLLKKPAQALAAGFVLALVLALCMAFTPLGQNLQKYSEEGSAGTLTGRTNLWAEAWPNIEQHPILGNGYRASRFLSQDIPGVFLEADNMHNSFMEVLYNNGIAGLIPILIMNVLIVVNLWGVILRPPTVELRYYAAATLALATHLVVWGLVAVTFGGAPDNRFMTFFAILLISMFLRGRCDKKYWNKVYGQHLS